MTVKQFFDWQTGGGTDDVMRLVDALERADASWCAIGGLAVNHWAAEYSFASPRSKLKLLTADRTCMNVRTCVRL